MRESRTASAVTWTTVGDGPVLICLPGPGEVIACGDALVAELAGDARVVAVDATRAPADLPAYVAQLAELFAEVGPAHLAGFGPGAASAVEAARRYAGQVGSLALVDVADNALPTPPEVSTLVVSDGIADRELTERVPAAVRVSIEHVASPFVRSAPRSVAAWLLAHVEIVEGLAAVGPGRGEPAYRVGEDGS